MKKLIQLGICLVTFSLLLSSCYTYTYTVGKGPQSNVVVKKKNHYVIYGLVPLSTSDPIKMAGDAQNYEVTVQHSFLDGLVNSLTFGIYNPTTTKVVK